jgi:hypothetical protein
MYDEKCVQSFFTCAKLTPDCLAVVVGTGLMIQFGFGFHWVGTSHVVVWF